MATDYTTLEKIWKEYGPCEVLFKHRPHIRLFLLAKSIAAPNSFVVEDEVSHITQYYANHTVWKPIQNAEPIQNASMNIWDPATRETKDDRIRYLEQLVESFEKTSMRHL
jgi:hypothetical protein